MDWTPHISAILVLFGTALGIIGSVIVQWIVQRNENARHLRKIAYEAAVKDWEGMRDFIFREVELTCKVQASGGRINPPKVKMPVIDDYLVYHLAVTEEIAYMNLRKATAEDIAALVARVRAMAKDMDAFRNHAEKAA